MIVVVSGYVGKRITGIGRNLISLLSNTSCDNSYIVYVNEDMLDDFKIEKENVTLRTYGVSKASSIGNLLWTTFIFPWKAITNRADVALIPNFTLLLFKFKPTVVIMHDLIEFNVPDKFSKMKMFYRKRIADPLMVRRSDRVMTDSINSRNDIVCILDCPENKIDVVPCGVNTDFFVRMEEEMACGVLDSKGWPRKFLLSVGTIDHPGKNTYTLIKAFNKLCEEGYDGSLVLAGMPGTGYEVIEDAIENSAYRDRIIVTGFVSDDELVALYSTCEVFCFLSLYEGFGLPPLEALACGAKVVVSNRSSLPEVVGDCGKCVNPLDIDEVTRAIDSSLCEERNDEAIERHLGRFNWCNLGSMFEDVLHKCVNEKLAHARAMSIVGIS